MRVKRRLGDRKESLSFFYVITYCKEAGSNEKGGEAIPVATASTGKVDSSRSNQGESTRPKEGVSRSTNGESSDLKVVSQPSIKHTRYDQGQTPGTKDTRKSKGILQDIFGENSEGDIVSSKNRSDVDSRESVENGATQLSKENESEGQRKRQQEEDEDIGNNIQQVSKEEDLSPRQSNCFKTNTTKGRLVFSLQVKTRRDREKANNTQ